MFDIFKIDVKKAVKLNMEAFSKIVEEEKIKTYQNSKAKVLEKCLENSNYRCSKYIQLEEERIKLEIEKEKSQYLSIIYSVFIFIIPIVITMLLKYYQVDTDYLDKNTLWSFLMYLLIIIVLFFTRVINKRQKFEICYIYLEVLNELKSNSIDKSKTKRIRRGWLRTYKFRILELRELLKR